MSNLGTKMAHNQHIQHVKELPYLVRKTPAKNNGPGVLQDGGSELENLITEITEMRDAGLFRPVVANLLKSNFSSLYGFLCA